MEPIPPKLPKYSSTIQTSRSVQGASSLAGIAGAIIILVGAANPGLAARLEIMAPSILVLGTSAFQILQAQGIIKGRKDVGDIVDKDGKSLRTGQNHPEYLARFTDVGEFKEVSSAYAAVKSACEVLQCDPQSLTSKIADLTVQKGKLEEKVQRVGGGTDIDTSNTQQSEKTLASEILSNGEQS